MSMWLAIVLVGLGSYAFRVVPMLLGERMRLSEGADATLRHAAVGAMTALMVLGVKRVAADPFSPDTIPLAWPLRSRERSRSSGAPCHWWCCAEE